MSTCPKCGAEITENNLHPVSPKSRLVAAILAWYFGVFGVHRFYAGRIVSGIFMILTFGGLGFWALVDAIVVLCGEFKDSDGLKIKTWID